MARPRVRTYLGLGANQGDATATLERAVADLEALPGIAVRGVSPLYVTAPWGVTDQPEFRNAVVAIDAPGGSDPSDAALALLTALKGLERDAGRGSGGERWGPRPLDIDILVFGRHRILVDRPVAARSLDADVDPAKAARMLEVPHRDARDRLFVLAPLAELAPRLVPPGWTETVARRRDAVAAGEPPGSVRRVGTWDGGSCRWLLGTSAPGRA